MLRHVIILALALAIAGCKFSGNDPARISFNQTLLDSDLNSSFSTAPHLKPSEPMIRPVDSFETFDHGPLEDFNFSHPGNYRRLSLDECIAMALQNSPVVRDLGGLILRAPDAAATDNDPALAYADPRLGEQAALSAFDAVYRGQLLFQKNDGLFNNQFIGDEGAFQQDLAEYRSGVSKLAATGAMYQFNHVVNYELNNSPSNRFNGTNSTSFAYDTFLEAEVRQPLFQGAGTSFNRIAGPNNAPGVYNGILIARANTDIALADFETRVRDLISDVENAYWDLYFAFRDLEAKIEARNGAYDIWRNVEANKGEKSAAIIGQAKEQYYRFAAEVEDAIHGRLNDGTRTNNGSSSGTFSRAGGVRTSERRLRLITGMALNENQLLVPSEMPVDAASVFDWQQSKNSAIARRPELRRQRWKIKARELELLASKNHLLPRVDLLAKYRLRGFGHNLFGDGNELQQGGTFEQQIDSSAFGTLLNNDLQEWEVGVDVSVPIGFRNQHAAQRHAQLNLARDLAILREQERQVVYGLSNAMGELARANRVRTANLNRLAAANEQFEAIQNIWREQDTTIDLVLEAQRRVIEAKLQYFQTQVEYMLAIKAIHFEEGTLFAYHNVALSESQADQLAEQQHLRRRQSPSRSISYWIPGLNTTYGPAAINNQMTSAAGTAVDAPNPISFDQTQFEQIPFQTVVPDHSTADQQWTNLADPNLGSPASVLLPTPPVDEALLSPPAAPAPNPNLPEAPSHWQSPSAFPIQPIESDVPMTPLLDPFDSATNGSKQQKALGRQVNFQESKTASLTKPDQPEPTNEAIQIQLTDRLAPVVQPSVFQTNASPVSAFSASPTPAPQKHPSATPGDLIPVKLPARLRTLKPLPPPVDSKDSPATRSSVELNFKDETISHSFGDQ